MVFEKRRAMSPMCAKVLVNPVPDMEMLEALPNNLVNSTLPLLMTAWQSYRQSAGLHPGLQAAVAKAF